jgi:hypothetical protein
MVDRLSFVDDPEAVRFFDELLLDTVTDVFPLLHVRIFLDHQSAQVPRLEHEDVGGTGRRIEAYEGGDDDLEGETDQPAIFPRAAVGPAPPLSSTFIKEPS